MKKSVIMIAVCGLLSGGFSEVVVKHETIGKISSNAKHLSQRYVILKNKKLAWTKRKKVLISKFKELYESADFLGSENRYGKLRLERHQKQFYTSLKAKDDEIDTKLIEIKKQLRKAKRRYSHLTQR
jgi:hypothetical protein